MCGRPNTQALKSGKVCMYICTYICMYVGVFLRPKSCCHREDTYFPPTLQQQQQHQQRSYDLCLSLFFSLFFDFLALKTPSIDCSSSSFVVAVVVVVDVFQTIPYTHLLLLLLCCEKRRERMQIFSHFSLLSSSLTKFPKKNLIKKAALFPKKENVILCRQPSYIIFFFSLVLHTDIQQH